MSSKFVKGTYRSSGSKHSEKRPKLYKSLGLRQGTINIKVPENTEEWIIIPNVRKEGCDQFDVDENQDFLLRSCRLKGVGGYQILPIDKTTGTPRGRHAEKVIEIALRKEIGIKDGEELEVELEGF